ncbi:MAG: NAD-dependent dihydropyrimidine dehydrogenase subunit PreA [Acidobacteria bacterium]|nr:MAG: NAD-dependent dihydropyrimidine dehydrogenase subunit PreA [Acidobacteriota bacterium]RPJ76255.1 MAG: NAD-dependent dihydropyrimidine dehydrogenase subunit PreA [Acidobacteriota bacterium]
MADLAISFAGIKSPNPFWLASGPPTNSGEQVLRAFEAGWGGCVWKTLGDPIVNVSSRFGAIGVGGQRMVGFNNIELITDRPLEDNLREIREVKRRFPANAMVVSIMEDRLEDWRELIRRVEDTGADGIELNFGCPHGMCERGMGSAVGQEPAVLTEITRWARDATTLPVLVKLTPNVSDILDPALAAIEGGASGLSLINTIKSLMGVDLDRLVPLPVVGSRSTNGGYCGPAVKPIALHMVAALARDPRITLPISGIGGIQSWRDAAEFIALGATSVQVCTAVMHYGFRIVEDLIDGLDGYLDDKGFASVGDLRGRAVAAFTEWGDLDMNYKVVARIDPAACIGCDLCYVACRDGAVACIHVPERGPSPAGWVPGAGGARRPPPQIDEPACIGCNLCSHVCPVDGCITMVAVDEGKGFESWNDRVRRASL